MYKEKNSDLLLTIFFNRNKKNNNKMTMGN